MQIAPLSATFSITTWRAIKCNVDTGSETFSRSYLSPCRIAINFKYEILPSRIFTNSRSIRAITSAAPCGVESIFKCRAKSRASCIQYRHSLLRNVSRPGHLHPPIARWTSDLFANDFIAGRETLFSRVAHRITLAYNFPWIRGDRPESLCPVLLFSFPPQRHLSSSRNASSLSLLVSFSLSVSFSL